MSADTALLVIDVQSGLMEEVYQPDELLDTVKGLLERARSSDTPVVYVQHDGPVGDSLEAGTSGWQIHPRIAPREGETVVRKQSPDAFHATSLQAELARRNIKRLVIVGAQTEVCVESTARRAVSQGYDVVLAADAHATADRETLSAEQIVAFTNEVLHGHRAGDHVVRVLPASEISFS